MASFRKNKGASRTEKIIEEVNIIPKSLVIITNTYPFGKGEEFLETEILYLQPHFDRIDIFALAPQEDFARKLPERVFCSKLRIDSNFIDRVMATRFMFSRLFAQEIRDVLKNPELKLTWSALTKALSMLSKRNKLSKIISNHISSVIGETEVYLYSYWMHHGAFGLTSERLRGFNAVSFCRGHGYDIYFEREADNYLPFRKFIVDNLDKVFLISENGREYLTEHLPGIDDTKLEVSRLGIRNNRSPAKISADNVLRIVSCSRISEIKRLDLIIDALAEIDDFPIIWTHIGDGELMSHICNYAKEKLDTKPNVEFELKGYLSNSEVFDFYENNEVDLFLNVSKSEGIPVSIMEAFSFGVPAIATDVGGVREIVGETCGYLISPQPSAKELRNAIITFRRLSNDAVMKIKRSARVKWNESFNAEKNYKQFVKSILNIGGEN